MGGGIYNIGPSGVRALPLAAGRNEGGHYFGHSPTQPQHELVLDLIMGRNPPHPTTPPGTFKALPGNLGS